MDFNTSAYELLRLDDRKIIVTGVLLVVDGDVRRFRLEPVVASARARTNQC